MCKKFLFLSFLAILAFLLAANTGIAKAAYQPGPMVTFTFDDGAKRIYENAAPILYENGIPAVLYAETGPLNSGEDWIMSWDQVRDLRDTYGWEIGSHSITHPYLTQISEAQLIDELLGSKNEFAAEGIDVKSFAAPYGDYDNNVLATIAKYYQSHRAAWGGANQWPYTYNDYEIVAYEIANTTTPEEVYTWIDTAVNNGQWLVFLMHDIVDREPNPYEYNVDDLRDVVEYAAASPIKATTVSEALNYSDQPNLIDNFTFTDLTGGWANFWNRDNSTDITIDTGGHGNVYGPENSLKIVGGESTRNVWTNVNVDGSKEYLLRMYQNVQDLTAGGWAIWVDEYDSGQQWQGGQWLGGNYCNFTGDRYYEYTPVSSNVSNISIIIYTEESSQLTLYIDSVELRALDQPGQDTIPPVITLLGDQTIDLNLGDDFIEPGFTATDDVDGDITGSVVVGGDTVDTNTVGTYTITYNVTDSSGNPAVEVTRTVVVSYPPGWCTQPELSLGKTKVYWASQPDYDNRILSIDFNLTNRSAFDVQGIEVVGSKNSAGVLTYTSMPITVGDLTGGSDDSSSFTIKHLIPAGTLSFTTTVYAAANDLCGNLYEYPGAYPSS